MENFINRYEFLNELILPKSFVEITEQYGFIMGHIIAFKKAIDDIKIEFKENFKCLAKEFDFLPEDAK